MTDSITTCPIWGDDSEAEGERQSEQGLMTVKFSARAGGAYEITEEVSLSVQELSNSQKARLTTILINQRNQGDRRPKVTTEIVEYAKRKRPIPIYERAERLLQYFVENTPIIGSSLKIGYHDQFQWCALAWSESVEITEVFSLDTYLEGRGWVQLNGNEIKVQVDGYSRVADLATNVDSSQAFVAMWFHAKTKDLYEQGIAPAIEGAGYRPMRIDEKDDLNKTDDEIIAEIRRSRFLVADFTHGCDGARGSVYFEAGFAYGLDIQVVHTCRSDLVDGLHFDIRQYNHIRWDESNYEDFCKRLRTRIIARIGSGPKIDAN